MIQLDKTQ